MDKVTTAITNSYAYGSVEALNIENITKSAKATIDKSILDQSWGMFKQFLAYKLKHKYRTELIEVNPQYTSQKCSSYGHINADTRKNQASFKCVNYQ